MCVRCCHFLRFLKNNTWNHFLDRNEVLMQKIINIDSVVWQLTRSFSQQVSEPVSEPASHGKPFIIYLLETYCWAFRPSQTQYSIEKYKKNVQYNN